MLVQYCLSRAMDAEGLVAAADPPLATPNFVTASHKILTLQALSNAGTAKRDCLVRGKVERCYALFFLTPEGGWKKTHQTKGSPKPLWEGCAS